MSASMVIYGFHSNLGHQLFLFFFFFTFCAWSLMNCLLDFLSCAVATAAAKLLQLCLTLCEPMDCSPPGSSAPGILQARILERVAVSFSNACMHIKSLQSFLTLCDPIDGSPLGSSVHRILQARRLEWVAISFSILSCE